jgi:flagellar biosynthetic protein FliR
MNDLVDDLAALLNVAEGLAWAAVVVFLRVGAMVALMPGFGEQAVPQRVKLALVLAFTLILAPIVAEMPGLPGPAVTVLASEAVAGLVLGVGMRLFLLGLQTAAVMIAQATTLSQLFAGATPDPQPAIGNLFVVAGIALALVAGLHLQAVQLVLLSYELLPSGAAADPAQLADWNLSLISRTFSLAFSLAAPFIIAAMIYNLALGAINRAMPHLMVSMVGAPALTLAALALLAVATPALLAVWLHGLDAFLADPFGSAP